MLPETEISMRYWMVKFAPFRVSWEQILATGYFEIYGVRSPQARNNLKAMAAGDKVLFYHSQTEKHIMGVMSVRREAHPDFTTADTRWVSVTFEPERSLVPPIPLQSLKDCPELANLSFLRQPRLAVSEMTEEEYTTIVGLSSQSVR